MPVQPACDSVGTGRATTCSTSSTDRETLWVTSTVWRLVPVPGTKPYKDMRARGRRSTIEPSPKTIQDSRRSRTTESSVGHVFEGQEMAGPAENGQLAVSFTDILL